MPSQQLDWTCGLSKNIFWIKIFSHLEIISNFCLGLVGDMIQRVNSSGFSWCQANLLKTWTWCQGPELDVKQNQMKWPIESCSQQIIKKIGNDFTNGWIFWSRKYFFDSPSPVRSSRGQDLIFLTFFEFTNCCNNHSNPILREKTTTSLF